MAFTATSRPSLEEKLYYNTGTHASPTWVEVKRAQDVSDSKSKGEGATGRRESKFAFVRGTQFEIEISFNYLHKPGADTVFDAINDSYWNNTPVEFWVADGAAGVSGTQGLRAVCEVMSLNDGQPQDGVDTKDVTAKPTDYEESGVLIEPDWHEV